MSDNEKEIVSRLNTFKNSVEENLATVGNNESLTLDEFALEVIGMMNEVIFIATQAKEYVEDIRKRDSGWWR